MKTPKERIVELHMGKSIEEIEENNCIIQELITNKKDQPWSEILRQRTAANIKSAEAHRSWKAALDINTLGQSDQVAKEAYDKRSAALHEYNRCHAEAFRISEMFNSVYRDVAGADEVEE